MKGGQEYSLPVCAVIQSGIGDSFLRKRSAHEILASSLSCGCGDNALVFLDAVQREGKETLLVDAAELSYSSLLYNFSGHVVVAVREPGSNGDWELVDSTNLRVLSKHWSSTEKLFEVFGTKFWVGYCGGLDRYPLHSPQKILRRHPQNCAGFGDVGCASGNELSG
jgi:hypothetical protein